MVHLSWYLVTLNRNKNKRIIGPLSHLSLVLVVEVTLLSRRYRVADMHDTCRYADMHVPTEALQVTYPAQAAVG